MDIGEVTQRHNGKRILRSNVQPGQHFYATEDVRSLCLAITDGDATSILRKHIERPNVVFHVHRESGTLSYMRPTEHVYVSLDLESL